jgi:hypothetical protein
VADAVVDPAPASARSGCRAEASPATAARLQKLAALRGACGKQLLQAVKAICCCLGIRRLGERLNELDEGSTQLMHAVSERVCRNKDDWADIIDKRMVSATGWPSQSLLSARRDVELPTGSTCSAAGLAVRRNNLRLGNTTPGNFAPAGRTHWSGFLCSA